MGSIKTSELEKFGLEIINHFHGSIYLLEVLDNLKFVLLEANAQFEEEIGRPLEQCIGRNLDDCFDSESGRMINDKLRDCVETSETITGTIELMLSNEKHIYYCTFIPILNEAKVVHRIIGIRNRITKEKTPIDTHKSQHPYLQVQSSLRSLMEDAPFGVILMNEMTPAFINRAIFSFAGMPFIKKAEKVNLIDYVHQSDREPLLKLLKSIVANEYDNSYQLTIRGAHASNSEKFFDLYLASHVVGSNKQIHIIVVATSEELEKEKLLNQLAFISLLSTRKNDVLLETYNELENIIKAENYKSSAFESILNKLEIYSDNDMDWNLFAYHIESLCPNFITNLRVLNPSLTSYDIKHCACIRLNYDTKETAKFFNVTPTSIQKSRVRLKKKLNISENIDLREFIINL